jgi:hypothetical protein
VAKLPKSRFPLVFSLIMASMMVFVMTFVVTVVNVGLASDFLVRWAKAYSIAFVVAVPTIYTLAPIARRLAARIAEMP